MINYIYFWLRWACSLICVGVIDSCKEMMLLLSLIEVTSLFSFPQGRRCCSHWSRSPHFSHSPTKRCYCSHWSRRPTPLTQQGDITSLAHKRNPTSLTHHGDHTCTFLIDQVHNTIQHRHPDLHIHTNKGFLQQKEANIDHTTLEVPSTFPNHPTQAMGPANQSSRKRVIEW